MHLVKLLKLPMPYFTHFYRRHSSISSKDYMSRLNLSYFHLRNEITKNIIITKIWSCEVRHIANMLLSMFQKCYLFKSIRLVLLIVEKNVYSIPTLSGTDKSVLGTQGAERQNHGFALRGPTNGWFPKRKILVLELFPNNWCNKENMYLFLGGWW